MLTLSANDRISISRRTVGADGSVSAPGVIARTGVQLYYAHELGLDGDPFRAVRLLRPEDEVFSHTSMSTFEGVPVTVEHPDGLVTAATHDALSVGRASKISRDGQRMTAIIEVTKKEGIDALATGKQELSNGYIFDLDLTPGFDPVFGAYDAVQRNIRGNHVAIVDAARCGSACKIADSSPPPKKEIEMEKIIIDGVPVELSEQAAAIVSKAIKAADAKLATATAEALALQEEHSTCIAAKDAEIAELKKDVMTPAARDAMVADWAAMLAAAKLLAPTVVTDGKTCATVRAEVVDHIAASADPLAKVAKSLLGGKSAKDVAHDIVRTAFDALAVLQETNQASKTVEGNDDARALLGQSKKTDEAPVLVGRDAMLARQAASLTA